MVRTYIRKGRKPSYSPDTLKKAIEEVKSGRMTVYRASKIYSIPKATLFTHVKGTRGVKSKTQGRPTALSPETEKHIADGIKKMAQWGFGLSKKEMLELIGRYVQQNKIVTPFRDGIPGDDFFNRFKKTNNLSLRTPQSVEAARKKSIDPFSISNYFELLKRVSENLTPSQIWNLDETSFCLDPSKTKVIAPKGSSVHRVTAGSGKENITVLMACNAAGQKAPPLIVFKGKHVWDSWMAASNEEFTGMTYAATKNGWMELETFRNYFEKSFLNIIGAKRPVLLIYDGHSSHIDLKLVQKACEENVIILKLPPHTSHVLQPLDLCVFKSLKQRWDERLIKWQRNNYGTKLPKRIFSALIAQIWTETDPEIISNGFKKAGIVPFNDKVISKDMFEPQLYKRWRQFCQGDKENQDVVQTDSQVDSTSVAAINESTYDKSPTLPLLVETQSMQNDFAREQIESLPSVSDLNVKSNADKIENSQTTPSRRTTFEDILLETIKQKPLKTNIKRRRICFGAEVITSDEAKNRLIQNAQEKENKKNQSKAVKKAHKIKKRFPTV